MKKLRNLIPLSLIVFILSIVATITASAAKVGDPYSVWGVQIGYVLIILAIVFAFLCWAFIDKVATAKKVAIPICAILVVAGLICALTDVAVEPVTAEVTPDVVWSVSASVTGSDITVDNDLNKIIIMCRVNDEAGTILQSDGTTAFTDPVINFTIAPTITEGLTDVTLAATTLANVVNPDAAFTVSGTSYDLFSDVSGTTGDKDLAWLADGTTEYEWHYVTVPFGDSEHAVLTVVYNPAGISQLTNGTIKASSISIGGQTYAMSLIVTGSEA